MTPDELREALRLANVELRRSALVEVERQPSSELRRIAVEALSDVDWRVRAEAVNAVVTGEPEPEISRQLVAILIEGTDVAHRNAAVEALGRMGNAAVASLSERLEDLNADGHKLAAEALARTGTEAALGPLKVLARDRDPNVCAAAVEAIGEVGRVAPEQTLSILDEAFLRTESFVRLAALGSARRLGLALPWRMLEPLLADPALVGTVLDLAASMDEPAAAKHFVAQLAVSSGRTWAAAVHGLRRFAQRSPKARRVTRTALEQVDAAVVAGLLFAVISDRTESLDALVVLALAGHAAAPEHTLGWLGSDVDSEAIAVCVEALGASILPGLVERLSDEREAVRAQAFEWLARVAEDAALRPKVLAALRAAPRDPSSLVVRAWLGAIARLGEAEDFLLVAERFGAGTSVPLRRAVMLALQAGARRFPELGAEVAREVSPLSERAGAAAVILSVSETSIHGGEEADIDWLLRARSNPSPAVRMAVIEALSKMRHPSAAEALASCSNDEAPEVKLAAMRALGVAAAAGVEVARQRLLETCRDSSDVALVVAGLQALGEGTNPELLGQLEPLLSAGEDWRAFAAIGALAGYPASVRLPALRQATLHRASEVVKRALELVEPSEVTLDLLVECLAHPAWDVRRLAADRLGQVPARSAGVALEARLALEHEPAVVSAIHRSLSQLVAGDAIQWSLLPPDSGRSS